MDGPRLSDEKFFRVHLKLPEPEQADMIRALDVRDNKQARGIFADYIRRTLEPDRYFKVRYEEPENDYLLDGETESAAAKRIIEKRLISCGEPYDFGEQIDWYKNPTYNQYKEWTWQLNRHNEWKLLAHYYKQTGDEAAAGAVAEMFGSWVRQCVVPEDVKGDATKAWRTIECGIRMGANWPYVLHACIASPAFTDDLLVDWYKSLWEHGNRLRKHHMHGNWLIMEMNGLAHIGILYPVLKESKEWLTYATDMLRRELKRQIYPDGFQYELTTGYHEVVVNNYQRYIELAQAYEVPVPEEVRRTMEHACELDIKLMMPDGHLVNINDAASARTAKLLSTKRELFPGNPSLIWAATEGKEGEEPAYRSICLPYSGMAVMRTDWSDRSVFGFLDAGPFGRGHQHEDKLAFIMCNGRKNVLPDAGTYAYDTSKMRDYVQSTYGHNTVLVDGMNQNRRKDYDWKEDEIGEESGIRFAASDAYDYAEGSYDEGYGVDAARICRHTRSVYFIKRQEGLRPFFIIVDRLEGDAPHEYDILWHVNEDGICKDKNSIRSADLDICYSQAVSGLDISCGVKEPRWEGWLSEGGRQGAERPIPTVKEIAEGKSVRVVNLLYPKDRAESVIRSVDAGRNPADRDIDICLSDGKHIMLDEDKLQLQL